MLSAPRVILLPDCVERNLGVMQLTRGYCEGLVRIHFCGLGAVFVGLVKWRCKRADRILIVE